MLSYKEFGELIKSSSIIVLDNNILLDLYRNPPSVSRDLLKLFEKLIMQLWIPNQVYQEFLKNYNEVRGKEKKKYQKIQDELNAVTEKIRKEIDNKIKGYTRYNYSDLDSLKVQFFNEINNLDRITDIYLENHKAEINENEKFLNDDEVKIFLDKLYKKLRVGNQISFIKRMEILKEGELRYANLIPPGYKDSNKGKEGMPGNQYGDLFVWKEIIEIARQKELNIVFVTNDVKEDWWELDKKGQPLCIRDELKMEFEEMAKQKIEFVTLNGFYIHMSRMLKMESLITSLMLEFDQYSKAILSDEEFYKVYKIKLLEFLNLEDLEQYTVGNCKNFILKDDRLEMCEANISIEENTANYFINGKSIVTYRVSELNAKECSKLVMNLSSEIHIKREIYENDRWEMGYKFENVIFTVQGNEYIQAELLRS